MSEHPLTLSYAPRANASTIRAHAIASLCLCYAVPLLCVAWSWAGICWTNWRLFGAWRLDAIFAPATGSDWYERCFLWLPAIASTIAPVIGLIWSLAHPVSASGRRGVVVACGASLFASSIVVTGFILIVLGDAASP